MSIDYAIPTLASDEELASTFGCVQMESVALRILKQIEHENKWEAGIDCLDYAGEDMLVGFAMLLAYGWLEPDYPNGMFIVSDEFAERISTLLPINYTERSLFLRNDTTL